MNILCERKELVGKRILVCNNEEIDTYNKLQWQCGVVRCASSHNLDDSDFMIYIEWDEEESHDWKKLEDFRNIFIERGVTMTEHSLCGRMTAALIFHRQRGIQLPTNHVLVEFLNDRHRAFVREKNIRVVEKEEDLLTGSSGKTRDAANDWLTVQRAQKILADSRSCLPGSRILVFRGNSSIKWFNALIIRRDGDLLHIMNEQVLTETTVDPSLTQIRFLDPNFVRDVINGDVDSAARRSRRSTRSSSCNALDFQKNRKRGSKRRSVVRLPSPDPPPEGETTPQSSNPSDAPKRDISSNQTFITKLPLCLSKSAPTSSAVSRDNDAQLPQTPPPDCDATMIDAAQSLLNISCKYKQEIATSPAAASSSSVPPPPASSSYAPPASPCPPVASSSYPPPFASPTPREDDVVSEPLTPTIHVPKPILAHKPPVTHVFTSPMMTSQSNFIPNSQSGSFEAYKKPCSKTKADDYSGVTMHHSQHSRQLTALAAQQALLQQNQQQNQQQQQQQQQNQQLSQPQMMTPHQLITNPYLNPYGLQLFYGNPALSGSLNASTLVQAQLQAAAVAMASNRAVAPQTMMPWMKDQLEKDLQHTQQQQALYAALWRNKPPEEVTPALYRGDAGGGSSPKTPQSSPGLEPMKAGHALCKDEKLPERAHSQKSLPRPSSPRRPHDLEGNLARSFPNPHEHPQTSPPVGQASYTKPSVQPQTYKSAIMKERDRILRLQQEEKQKLEEAQARKLQELEREVKRREDMWRAKITKNPTIGRNDATKKFIGEKERMSELTQQSTRSDKPPNVWGMQHPTPQSIAPIPLSMIDPATFVAAHAAKLISDETVLQNGAPDVERKPSNSKSPSVTHSELQRQKYPPPLSSSSQSVSSRKIWQPPVIPTKPVSSEKSLSLPSKPPLKTPEASSANLPFPYTGYRLPTKTSGVQVKPSSNHVVNIHSLKYSPPSSSPKPPRTMASPRPFSEKAVIVKTSPVASHTDTQTVKFISDRGQATHLAPNRSPTPPLGPLMADGSRARILSEASLRNLYHFPSPLSKPGSKTTEEKPDKTSDQVIINEPHYKVTALTGNHDNATKVTSMSPSHLVYAKPAMSLRAEMTSRASSPSRGGIVKEDDTVKSARKRSGNSDDADPSKKMCKEESRVYFPRYNTSSHATANLPDVVTTTDPVLRELVANGIFGVTTSSIVWRDPTQIVDQYPGTPSKVALKGALMGLKTENGWNLSSRDSTHGSPPFSIPTEGRDPPSSQPHSPVSSSNVFPTTSDSQESPIVYPQKQNHKSFKVEPRSPSNHHSASPTKPFDLSLNPIPQSMDPTATVPVTVETSNFKALASGSSNSPASDVSGVSDLSWGSNKPKTSSGEGSGTKSAACPKLKKAWLKRMSDEPDDSVKASVKCSSPEELPTSPLVIISYPGTPVEEKLPSEPSSPHDQSIDPPAKKAKKKHRNKEKKNKDPERKKRKHKEGKKSKKSDYDCPADIHSPTLGSTGVKEGATDPCMNALSNSKLFLMGRFDQSTPEDESDDLVEEGGDLKKSKKKIGARRMRSEMPTGKNGLPISVLLCKKEQARLRRSGEAFMQDAPCHEIIAMSGVTTQALPSGLSSVPKCRECGNAKRKENNTVFCRFYGFRKLAFTNGFLHASGFCDPEDSRPCDVRLWLPTMGKSGDSNHKPSLELETCRYIMKHIGGKFCELVRDEREEMAKASLSDAIRWKRPVSGVREMCDACETTLFNLHWVCHKCGFAVCSDCYNLRRGMSVPELEAYDADRNNLYRWMTCTKGKHHAPSQLVPTQIIPSSCLFDLYELAHQACARWSITSQCRCKKGEFLHAPRPTDPTPLLKNHCNSALLSHSAGKVTSSKPDVKTSVNRDSNRFKSYDCESSASPLDWLASIALREQRKSSVTPSSNVTSSLIKGIGEDNKPGKEASKTSLQQRAGLLATPSKAAPRSWLCNGQLLQLTDSTSEVNVDTFQLHWFYGMPVMASGASHNLNRDLWRPETFSREHGDESTGSALINCRKGSIITNAFIKDFWNGFESIENRLRDERSGQRMILKLKDWPTTEDFIDTMPDKYEDLMRGLPLPQYTARNGKYNMAAHLPDFFVRPDLGPKMYIAYGWVSESDWSQGTTNLHLDISDACNLMVYVGIPNDEPAGAQDALIKIIKEGDADAAQIERAKTHKPGALWHIFKASDTDKIRKLILKVKAEKGIVVSEDHDPIHDQQIYLDQTLRRRLREEHDVEGYPLVQCEGDSVFIPAGAPHQVFNLHSCIKVAEDFVSPEHVDKCFKLTEEFRRLSTGHSNHEDKLQLKNIILHTMKEIVASLSWHEANGGLEADVDKGRP